MLDDLNFKGTKTLNEPKQMAFKTFCSTVLANLLLFDAKQLSLF